MAEPRYSAGALLRQITDLALDPGYAQRAQRRPRPTAAAGGSGPAGRPGGRRSGRLPRQLVLLLLFVAVGGTAAASAAQLRTVPPDAAARAVLVEEIERRQDAADELAERNEALRAEIDEAERALLGREGGVRAAALDRLGVATGALPVEGSGLVVVLTDAEPAELTDEVADPLGTVRDTDVQSVVNGLWFAGAEAVSVNGQRLTTLSAIRRAGDAILVDFRPLAPPYTIEAVGDPDALAEELSTGRAGRYAAFLRENYGVGVSVDRAGGLRLPAASALVLEHAARRTPVEGAPAEQGQPRSPGAGPPGETS